MKNVYFNYKKTQLFCDVDDFGSSSLLFKVIDIFLIVTYIMLCIFSGAIVEETKNIVAVQSVSIIRIKK